MSSPLTEVLRDLKATFDRSTSWLTEEDAAFAPAEGMYTAAQHVAHVAQTVEWFVEGAFRAHGFNLDFAALDEAVRAVATEAEARAWLDRAFDAACAVLDAKSAEDMGQPIANGPILGGAPRMAIVGGITDHTAHHRGALTVYARLCGKQPPLPYA
ncbi:MAG: DinB family protein [Planctomycetota bacterium]|nr:DinB family protein [Planctomycetota bacterium]